MDPSHIEMLCVDFQTNHSIRTFYGDSDPAISPLSRREATPTSCLCSPYSFQSTSILISLKRLSCTPPIMNIHGFRNYTTVKNHWSTSRVPLDTGTLEKKYEAMVKVYTPISKHPPINPLAIDCPSAWDDWEFKLCCVVALLPRSA